MLVEHTNGRLVDDETAVPVNGSTTRNILDIRRDVQQLSLIDEIQKGLNPDHGQEKTLPTLLLYSEKGLQLFEEITYLDEYYPTNAEIEVLNNHAASIAKRIQPGSILVELGSGNLRKVDILLRAIDAQGKSVDYYALDLSERELERTLSAIPGDAYRHVRCFGLLGTYDDGLEWLKTAELKHKTKIVMSLGSSIGNFDRSDAAGFLQSFARVLGDNDQLLIGLDACKDAAKVQLAYNDSHGLTHRFYLQGLLYANDILGKPVFDVSQWNVIGQYDELNGRHQAFMSPTCDVAVGDVIVHAGELIRLEEAYKYSAAESAKLWTDARLRPVDQWSNRSGDYAIHMLGKSAYAQPLDATAYASEPCPLLSEWTDLWALWDAVTRKMIPDEELLNKPIKLRNACIFYLGHIPTFLDMKIASQTDGINTDPKNYPNIFERGIDPDVDNPEQCHAHSEIPDEWPPLGEILTFQQRVRQRVTSLYESGAAANDPKVQRVLWLGYEHEAMHLETLLYMLVQSEKTLPPPNTPVPNFDVLASQADAAAVPNTWFTIPATTFEVGTNDPQTASGPKRYFGWDIETPIRKTAVPSFSASARPISNGEYAAYLEATSSTKLPAAWICSPSTNGYDAATVKTSSTTPSAAFLAGKSVRTVYGAVPLSFALHWPASASYDELAGCAAHMGGRIPSQDEVLSIYRHSEALAAAKQADPTNGTPAVNAHLINNGVRESPPALEAQELHAGAAFADLHGTNVGFQHWHPAPVTQLGGALGGRGAMGGVWEWTSTPLAPHDGYEPMPLYQAYSSDFFDGKHNVVLGGSWATVPRIAGRRSFVNWYQRNYPYVWAGARVVRDL